MCQCVFLYCSDWLVSSTTKVKTKQVIITPDDCFQLRSVFRPIIELRKFTLVSEKNNGASEGKRVFRAIEEIVSNFISHVIIKGLFIE